MPTLQLLEGCKLFAAGRSYGVQKGERLMFRFTADSPQQLQATNFTTTGPKSKIAGIYAISAMIRDIELDTKGDESFDFFIGRETQSGLEEPVLPTMRFQPRKLFAEVPAEGQIDANACWAASIAWYSAAMRTRATVSQLNLLVRFAGMWNSDGTINLDQFEKGVKDAADLKLQTKRINPTQLKNFLGYWPIIIGFQAPGGFGHMNVLYGHGASGKVKAMEPWFPDPGPNGLEMSEGTMIVTDANFKFTGQLVERPATHWGKAAPGNHQLIISYPQEYLDKI